MREKIQKFCEAVSRYEGTDFITLNQLNKLSKLIKELEEESRKKTNMGDAV